MFLLVCFRVFLRPLFCGEFSSVHFPLSLLEKRDPKPFSRNCVSGVWQRLIFRIGLRFWNRDVLRGIARFWLSTTIIQNAISALLWASSQGRLSHFVVSSRIPSPSKTLRYSQVHSSATSFNNQPSRLSPDNHASPSLTGIVFDTQASVGEAACRLSLARRKSRRQLWINSQFFVI